jgi:predicted Zn-dependent peptidase
VTSTIAAGPRGSRVATLQNGLVLGVLEEPGSPVFGIHLLVADRTAREPAGQDGAADLAHRLLGGGSQLSPGENFGRRLQRAGIDLTPADNPMIPMDDRYHVPAWSYVREEGPAEEFDTALELLAEMVRQPHWSAAAWEAALTQHRQSRRAGGQGSARLDAALRARLLGPEHPLARPASGRPDGTPPTEDQIKALWGDGEGGYFSPATFVLTVASPWDAAAVLERVQELFGSGPTGQPARFGYPDPGPGAAATAADVTPAAAPAKPGRPPTGMPPGMPPGADSGMLPGMPGGPPSGMPSGSGKGPGGPPPQLGLAWGCVAGVPPAEQAALLVAVSALEDRMTAELREKQGLLYRHDAGVRALPRGEWLISASFSTRPENEAQATAAFEALLAGLAAQPLPTADLERMFDRARRRAMLDGQSAVARAYMLGRQLYEGEASPLGITLAELEQVTPQAVQAAAAAWLDPSRMTRVRQ